MKRTSKIIRSTSYVKSNNQIMEALLLKNGTIDVIGYGIVEDAQYDYDGDYYFGGSLISKKGGSY